MVKKRIDFLIKSGDKIKSQPIRHSITIEPDPYSGYPYVRATERDGRGRSYEIKITDFYMPLRDYVCLVCKKNNNCDKINCIFEIGGVDCEDCVHESIIYTEPTQAGIMCCKEKIKYGKNIKRQCEEFKGIKIEEDFD